MNFWNRFKTLVSLGLLVWLSNASHAGFWDKEPRLETQFQGVPLKWLPVLKEAVPVHLLPPKSSEDLWEEWRQQAEQTLHMKLKFLGYLHNHVSSRMELTNDHHRRVHFVVVMGPRTRIKQVQFSIEGAGAQEPKLQQYLSDLPLQPGQFLNLERYRHVKQTLFDLADEQGYIEAQMTQHEIRIQDDHTAEIKGVLHTGSQYYFGEVTFSKTPFSPEFIQRFLNFFPNDIYSEKKLLELQDHLASSRYFQNVAVVGDRTHVKNHRVPVHITLKERKAQLYSAGIGYGTDTGKRISAGWDWRWLNRHGHSFSAMGNWSEKQQLLQAIYMIPGRNPIQDQYNILSSAKRSYLPLGYSELQQIGLNHTKKMSQWQRIIGVNYQKERFIDRLGPLQKAYTLLPNLSWTQTVGDHPLFPSSGHKISLSFLGSIDGLASRSTFLQTLAQTKYIHFFNKNTRILMRSEMGLNMGDQLIDLPLSLRFYAGGSQSVRGYSYQGMGPGTYLFTLSGEVQQRLYQQLFATVYYDAGNAFSSFPTRLNRGIGTGLVWLSPIGSVSVSVARAIDLKDKPYRLQISMGPDL